MRYLYKLNSPKPIHLARSQEDGSIVCQNTFKAKPGTGWVYDDSLPDGRRMCKVCVEMTPRHLKPKTIYGSTTRARVEIPNPKLEGLPW